MWSLILLDTVLTSLFQTERSRGLWVTSCKPNQYLWGHVCCFIVVIIILHKSVYGWCVIETKVKDENTEREREKTDVQSSPHMLIFLFSVSVAS